LNRAAQWRDGFAQDTGTDERGTRLLNEAIATLERFQMDAPKKRGRLPKWLAEAKRAVKPKAKAAEA